MEECDWTTGRYIRSITVTRTRKRQYIVQYCDGNGTASHPMRLFDSLEEVGEYIKHMEDSTP